MWRFGENKHEDEDLFMTVAGFLLIVSRLSEERKKNNKRLWVRQALSKRKIYGGDELLIDLRNDDTGLVENYEF
jgi:hypothetical protein